MKQNLSMIISKNTKGPAPNDHFTFRKSTPTVFFFANFGPLPALRNPKLYTTWQRNFRHKEVTFQAVTVAYSRWKFFPLISFSFHYFEDYLITKLSLR